MRFLTVLMLSISLVSCASTSGDSDEGDESSPGSTMQRLMDTIEDQKTLSALKRAIEDARIKTPFPREKHLIALAGDLFPCLMTESADGKPKVCSLKEDAVKYGEYSKLAGKFNRRTAQDTEVIGKGFRCAIQQLQDKMSQADDNECLETL